MDMSTALHGVLTEHFDDSGFRMAEEPYRGEWHRVGELVLRGNVQMTGLDAPEWIDFDELPDGRYTVHLAYENFDRALGGWCRRAVSAVAVVARDATPEEVAAAEYEQGSHDVNFLDDISAVYGDRPTPHWPIDLPPDVTSGPDDHASRAAVALARREAEGELPVIEVTLDAESGANAFVFPTFAPDCGSILVGRGREGDGLCVIWSEFC